MNSLITPENFDPTRHLALGFKKTTSPLPDWKHKAALTRSVRSQMGLLRSAITFSVWKSGYECWAAEVQRRRTSSSFRPIQTAPHRHRRQRVPSIRDHKHHTVIPDMIHLTIRDLIAQWAAMRRRVFSGSPPSSNVNLFMRSSKDWAAHSRLKLILRILRMQPIAPTIRYGAVLQQALSLLRAPEASPGGNGGSVEPFGRAVKGQRVWSSTQDHAQTAGLGPTRAGRKPPSAAASPTIQAMLQVNSRIRQTPSGQATWRSLVVCLVV